MSTASSPGLAIGLGVLVHNAIFRHGEWHMSGANIIAGHVVGLIALSVGRRLTQKLFELPVPAISWNFCVCYLLGLFGSMVLYRLFFHRLRSFSGPFGAKITKLWHVYQNGNSMNHELLEKLHHKYGEIFRVGPNELVIVHPQAHNAIDGPKNDCSKNDWYDVVQPNSSILFTRNQPMHDKRRKLWLQALNAKSLSQYQPRIFKHLDSFDRLVDSLANSGQIININSLIYRLTFDTMGEFAFAKDFGLLAPSADGESEKAAAADGESEDWHYAVAIMRAANEMLGPVNPATWMVHLGNALFPFMKPIQNFNRLLKFCQERIHERLAADDSIEDPDLASWLIREAKKNGLTETDKRWLEGDSIAVVVAGSETTAATLVFLFYCLATHPEDAEKIHEEVTGLNTRDLASISSLPHLSACISETQRLWPANPTFHPRKTGPEGITVGDTYIPGNVNVSAPRYLLGRMESCYENASRFAPERWYSSPEMIKDKNAFVPFSVGERSCSGKLLALAEIKHVTASVLQKYRLEVPEGCDPHRTASEMKDYGTVKPGRLDLRFIPRS